MPMDITADIPSMKQLVDVGLGVLCSLVLTGTAAAFWLWIGAQPVSPGIRLGTTLWLVAQKTVFVLPPSDCVGDQALDRLVEALRILFGSATAVLWPTAGTVQ